jgi:hypothetical protein
MTEGIFKKKETLPEVKFKGYSVSVRIFSIIIVLCIMTWLAVVLSTDDSSDTGEKTGAHKTPQQRIIELQNDIKSEKDFINILSSSEARRELEAEEAMSRGMSNPMGASDADRKAYSDAQSSMQENVILLKAALAKIKSDQDEIDGLNIKLEQIKNKANATTWE